MKIKKPSSNLLRKMAIRIAFAGFFYFMTGQIYAQGGSPAPILPHPPAQSPIGGGIGILAAAGGAYAIKKLKDKKND